MNVEHLLQEVVNLGAFDDDPHLFVERGDDDAVVAIQEEVGLGFEESCRITRVSLMGE